MFRDYSHRCSRAVRARQHNAMVPRVTAQEQVRRNAGVVKDRARGISWAEIGRRYDLSPKMCRSIWNDYLAAQPLEVGRPRDALAEAFLHFDAAIAELAELAESTANDAIRLGAVKARIDLFEKRHELARRAGLLPDAIHDAIRNQQTHEVTEGFIGTFRKYVPADLQYQAESELLSALKPTLSES